MTFGCVEWSQTVKHQYKIKTKLKTRTGIARNKENVP